MKFVVFSDVHIGGKFNEETFIRGVEYINNTDADFFVFTGDLTDQGTVSEYELVKEKYLPMIKKPVLLIPGNHDVKNVGDLLWEEYIGPRFFVHEDVDRKVKILGLDSNEPDTNTGRMGVKAIKRIYSEFQDLDDQWLKVLVFHHQTLPIKYTGRERSALIDAGDTIKAIMDCNVNLVLNGHRHISNVYKLTDGDIKTLIVNCGTMSCKKTRYHEQYSITTVDFDNTKEQAKVEVLLLNEQKWVTKFQGSVKEHTIPEDYGQLEATIVQIGNTEISADNIFDKNSFTKGVQLINSIDCDLVVHNGDITNQSYLSEFEMAKNYLGLIRHQTLIVPGPKDSFPLGTSVYGEYFGPEESEYADDNLTVLGINTCIIDEKIGRLGRNTSQELVTRLLQTANIKALAFHHNIIPIPRTKHDSELQDAGDVLALLVENNINLVLTGAKNTSGCWQIDNTVFVNTGTFSSLNYNNKKGNSFNIIQIYKTDKGRYYRISEQFFNYSETKLIGEFHVYN